MSRPRPLILYNSAVEAVLFDYGGTLDADGRTWLERFRPLYAAEGVDSASKSFERAFYDSEDGLPERFQIKGLTLEKTLVLLTRCVLEAAAPDRMASAEAIAERFLRDSRRTFRRNRPMLERLARRYRLGVVSNFYGNLRGVLEAEGLLELFGAVADSGVIGALKPDPALFRHALDALGCRPSAAIMVGDSLERDMRGAEALGMSHAFLAPTTKSPCCAAALRLDALTDLEAALETRLPTWG